MRSFLEMLTENMTNGAFTAFNHFQPEMPKEMQEEIESKKD